MNLDFMRNDGIPTCLFANNRIVKTKVPHVCQICGKEIQIGEIAQKHTIMTSDDCRPGTFYLHKEYCIDL